MFLATAKVSILLKRDMKVIIQVQQIKLELTLNLFKSKQRGKWETYFRDVRFSGTGTGRTSILKSPSLMLSLAVILAGAV